MKMRVLPSLMKKNLSAKMLGDYNMSQPKLYTDKIAGSLSACMGLSGMAVRGDSFPTRCWRAISEPR